MEEILFPGLRLFVISQNEGFCGICFSFVGQYPFCQPRQTLSLVENHFHHHYFILQNKLEFELELIWECVPLINCKQKSKKNSTLNVFCCNKPTFIQTLFVVSIVSRAWKTTTKSLIKSGGYPCQNKVKTVRYNIISSTFLE